MVEKWMRRDSLLRWKTIREIAVKMLPGEPLLWIFALQVRNGFKTLNGS